MDDPTSGTPMGNLKDAGRDRSVRSTASHSTLKWLLPKWLKRLCKSHLCFTPSLTTQQKSQKGGPVGLGPQLCSYHWEFITSQLPNMQTREKLPETNQSLWQILSFNPACGVSNTSTFCFPQHCGSEKTLKDFSLHKLKLNQQNMDSC